jgi:hypothetical protein
MQWRGRRRTENRRVSRASLAVGLRDRTLLYRIITMFAAMSFDPRLMRDGAGENT